MAKKPYHLRHQPRKSSSTTTQAFTVIILLLFFIMILLGLGILSLPNTSRNSSRPVDLTTIIRDSEERESYGNEDGNGDRWVEVISWEPRAFLYHNFMTNEECEHLISLAKPSMKKSKVVDVKTGGSKDSRFCYSLIYFSPSSLILNLTNRIMCRVRTSSGTFLKRGQDEIVEEIENRISDFTFIPVENGEGLQVLHYEVGQKYEPHHDYFSDEYNVKRGGNRIATVLMYLSDVEEGGETVFPAAKGNISDVPWWNELSQCGREGLSVLPKKRDALLFWSARPDASLDPSSLHGGCPVIKGNKWSSTKWFHFNEYTA
ncbi:probable prolyl 4-hydroxylase 8 isoform X1 [Brassica rapa]|uniref:probable prolyl 4-hydroxylase 8 isoform X1 n=1 Tax=Brassica campestris TaxID=3711 RepID=UPI00142DA039|nr:probable prolyl 4-hydroxylase 8 isoform X1 [Brassica rapa]XP_033133088.1 probable prolyl 4-hydroxylase 8 isoform X1 [Brassica rapa]